MKIVQEFYISTGAKNAMYTLRSVRRMHGMNPEFMPDHYIRNLAADLEKAEQKAAEYVDAYRERVGETEGFSIILSFGADNAIYARRGKLSVNDTRMIETIEAGISPFGKHAGEKIDDLPESYILFFADKYGHTEKPVMEVFAAACLGVALERGYIAKRDERRDEQRKKDLLSNFVGEIGVRQTFEGVVESVFYKETFEGGYYINKVRCGDDLVMYFGNKLGEKGESLKFKGTVKNHCEYEEVKSTQINRPKVI